MTTGVEGPPRELPSPPEDAVVVAEPAGPRFSRAVTGVCALVVVLFVLFVAWLHATSTRLDSVTDPDRALMLIVGRTMDAREALAQAPAWERQLYRLTVMDGGQDLREAIDWFDELAVASLDPHVDVALAILEGEAGLLARLRQSTAEWQRRPDPLPLLSRLIATAYLDATPDAEESRDLLDELADDLPGGWFSDRLATRLAARTGDVERGRLATDAMRERSRPLLRSIRELAAILLAVLAAGTASGVVVAARWRRGVDTLRVAAAPLPPPWRGRVGAAVLLRGGAVAAALTIGLNMVLLREGASDDAFVNVAVVVAVTAPLLFLARRHLLAPAGLGFRRGFGLWPEGGGGTALVFAVPLVLAAGFLGDQAISLLGEWWGQTAHWTEWFDAELAWGAPSAVLASLLASVVAAPVLEEIAFRGLLYGTLRRRWGVTASVVASAAVFAVAHGYGAWGFASVFWSGALWAVTYEKTRSLLPSIAAHAASNLTTSLAVLWLLRG